MPFGEQMPKMEQDNQRDERQVEADIDLIRRGASYEITGMPSDLADDLIKEQSGELYPDLATYIKLNKVIACPKEDLDEETAKRLATATGFITDNSGGEMYYVDVDGNIANFNANRDTLRKIRSVREIAEKDSILHRVYQELEALGFKWYNQAADLSGIVLGAVGKHRDKVREEKRKEKEDNFNF